MENSKNPKPNREILKSSHRQITLITGYFAQLQTANRKPQTANRKLQTANRQPPTANRQPPSPTPQPPTATHHPPFPDPGPLNSWSVHLTTPPCVHPCGLRSA